MISISKLKLETLQKLAFVIGGVWVLLHFYLTEFPKLSIAAAVSAKVNLYPITNAIPYNVELDLNIRNMGLTEFTVNKITIVGRRIKNTGDSRFLDFDKLFKSGEKLTDQEFTTANTEYNTVLLTRYPLGQNRVDCFFYNVNDFEMGEGVVFYISVEYSKGFTHGTIKTAYFRCVAKGEAKPLHG